MQSKRCIRKHLFDGRVPEASVLSLPHVPGAGGAGRGAGGGRRVLEVSNPKP